MICMQDYNIRAVNMILRLNISFKYMFLKVGPNKLCTKSGIMEIDRSPSCGSGEVNGSNEII